MVQNTKEVIKRRRRHSFIMKRVGSNGISTRGGGNKKASRKFKGDSAWRGNVLKIKMMSRSTSSGKRRGTIKNIGRSGWGQGGQPVRGDKPHQKIKEKKKVGGNFSPGGNSHKMKNEGFGKTLASLGKNPIRNGKGGKKPGL